MSKCDLDILPWYSTWIAHGKICEVEARLLTTTKHNSKILSKNTDVVQQNIAANRLSNNFSIRINEIHNLAKMLD